MWDDPSRAQKLISERTRLIDKIEKIQSIENEVQSLYEMIELAEFEGEEALLSEAEASFVALDAEIEEMLLSSLLSKEGDSNDSFLKAQLRQF